MFLFVSCYKDSKDNQVPVIKNLFASRNIVVKGNQTSITCIAEDLDGDQLIYEWETNAGSFEGTNSTTVWMADCDAGEYQIICTITDIHGAKVSEKTTPNPIINPKSIVQNESSSKAGNITKILQSKGTIQTCFG